jgi:phospholipid N-methyltransferase
MPHALHKKRDDRVVFLKEFLKHPHQVASIIPSSRFLERRVVALAGVRSAHTVVELGAGTGGITRAILREMPAHGKLVVIEVNPKFCALVRRIPDSRLIVSCGCAKTLRDAIASHGLPAPDVIVSGIPFSTISGIAGAQIVETVSTALAPGGRFVAYQFSKQVDDLARPLFGRARVEVEFFNIPPMRLYRWEKRAR